MPPLRLEPLEPRALLAVTGIDFLNNGGIRLADFTSVPDDADVLVRVRTQGMRGQVGTIHLYEDDAPLGSDYVGPVSFAVPTSSDVVVFRFDPSWVSDGDGTFGDPEFQLWASTSPLETISSQHLSVRAPASIDYDDTFAKAGWLGALSAERVVSGGISSPRDVDLFRFTAERGQWVSFDLDVGDGSLIDSYVRVFDASGRELASNDNGDTLTDTLAVESYKRDLEYPLALPTLSRPTSAFTHLVFPTAGTYYVAVSGAGNEVFDPVTGTGDADGSQGRYTLTLTPLTRVTGGSAAVTNGELRLPNPERADWRRTVIPVTLSRVADATGSAINPSLFTWILIHGRADSAASWRTGGLLSPAQLLAAQLGGDQVLTLDWSLGAASNASAVGLQGSAWIPLVGQWTQSLLTRWGIPGSRVGLIGHSWGTYVAYEVASRGDRAGRGPAGGLVALDPAYGGIAAEALGLQYAAADVDFAAHAGRSWAFYGSGSFGSWSLSRTATEAFALDYGLIPTTTTAAHDAPRDVFRQLLRVNNRLGTRAPLLYRLFHLRQLLQPTLTRPWRADQYAYGSLVEPATNAVFEGAFAVTGSSTEGGFELTAIARLTYKQTADGAEVNLPG